MWRNLFQLVCAFRVAQSRAHGFDKGTISKICPALKASGEHRKSSPSLHAREESLSQARLANARFSLQEDEMSVRPDSSIQILQSGQFRRAAYERIVILRWQVTDSGWLILTHRYALA